MSANKISDKADLLYSTLKNGIKDGYMGLDVGMLTTQNLEK